MLGRDDEIQIIFRFLLGDVLVLLGSFKHRSALCTVCTQ